MRRKLYLIGEITEEMYHKFSKRLDTLEAASKAPIEVEISSLGGSTYDALAIVGRIRNSKAPIHITAYGKIMSAAILIFASGHKRSASPETWFMTHQSSCKVQGELKHRLAEIEQSKLEDAQWCNLLEQYTGTTAMQWQRWNEETKYMTAKQALATGLVLEVLKGA